jgi:hypothetical protein
VSKSVNEYEAGKLFSLLACAETASKLFGVLIFVNPYHDFGQLSGDLVTNKTVTSISPTLQV